MKKIELVKGIESTVLGFGCAPILGSEGAKKSIRAISCAIDCGINHFDIARSYGYGSAEQFLGKAIQSKRKEVIIASKFGIKANLKAKILSPLKPILRYSLSMLPKKNTENQVSSQKSLTVADRFHYRISLNSFEMKNSLEESLRALKTDYLDYFFIHEPLGTIENIDDLFNLSYKLKQQGKIRGFGIAFYYNQKNLHEKYLKEFDILQFNNSPKKDEYIENVNQRGLMPNIIFSPLKGGGDDLKTPRAKLEKIAYDFPKSVILCSMFNENHIKNNSLIFS